MQEAVVQAALSFVKGGATLKFDFPSTYLDVAGNNGVENIADIGTSDETLALGDISTIGLVAMKNLDATNYILLGSDGTNYPIKLKPGEPFFGRWNGAAIHAKSNTASCRLHSLILPD